MSASIKPIEVEHFKIIAVTHIIQLVMNSQSRRSMIRRYPFVFNFSNNLKNYLFLFYCMSHS